MKRFIIVLILALMVFSLAGCGSSGSSFSPTGTGGVTGVTGTGGTTTGGTLGTLIDIGDGVHNDDTTNDGVENIDAVGNDFYYTATIDINANDEILGQTLGSHSPFVRSNTTTVMTFVPGHSGSYDDYYNLKDTASDKPFTTLQVVEINNSSQVIGNSIPKGSTGGETRAFIYDYSSDSFEDLAPLNYTSEGKRKFAEYSNVVDINEANWVLLTLENGDGEKHCYSWNGVSKVVVGDLLRDDDTPPAYIPVVPLYDAGVTIIGEESFAVAINDIFDGDSYQYVCNSGSTAIVYDGYDGTPINRFNSESLTAVDMNNALPVGHVVGNHGTDGFFWDGGVTYPISNPSGGSIDVIGINNNDLVVGNSNGHPFLWTLGADGNGVYQELGDLGGGSSTAVAVNDNGVVIGYSTTGEIYEEGGKTAAVVHGVAWYNGVIYDLGTHTPGYAYPFDSDYVFSAAKAINEANTIVGDSYSINSHHRGFVLAPVFP